jgi:transposase-like protein
MSKRSYSPEFKLQVVLEALQSDGTDAEVARAYDIHPVTLSNWKKQLKENGSKAFGGDDDLKEKQDKIAKLERMVGQKEVEIALLKNFLGES